jgi:hypothetical protein
MEGLAQANHRGLERILREKPDSVEAWTFARGQALLIAETANLLLMRPPRQGQALWLDRAGELRIAGLRLARTAAATDWDRSRAALVELTNTCNRCHQSFRVSTRIGPAEAARPPIP